MTAKDAHEIADKANICILLTNIENKIHEAALQGYYAYGFKLPKALRLSDLQYFKHNGFEIDYYGNKAVKISW